MNDVPPAVAPPTVPGLTGLSVLARGGYATVYRAVQESVGRDVAVKVENQRLDDDQDRRRFLREARAAGRMSSHPHVVDLFDAGVTAHGHPYLIMELCAGSYADRMRTHPLSAVEVREVGVKIADALADAHALGVLHRDVKPANILVSDFGEPALADFGLAILAETRDTSVALDVLTPAYAPPEMFRPSPPTPAVDVYSLCATLYALMNGRPPRWEDDRTPSLMTLTELFERPIPALPGIPDDLLDLLRLGMRNDPAERPSAAELRDRMAALALGDAPTMPHLPSPRPPASANTAAAAVRRDDTPTEPARPALDTPTEQVRPARRRGGLFGVGAGLVALALLIGGGTWYELDHVSHKVDTATDRSATPTSGAEPAGLTSPGTVVCGVDAGTRCPRTPECFGRLSVTRGVARAARTPCTKPHAWEVFALATLPPTTRSADYAKVRTDPTVRRVCSVVTLATRLPDLNVIGWQVDVLPPTPEAFAAGDRTVRCLAGRGSDELTAPAFTQ
ncbi:MAG TPA: serine/threonine-protein kinase [Micromonosporaceae bacterium]